MVFSEVQVSMYFVNRRPYTVSLKMRPVKNIIIFSIIAAVSAIGVAVAVSPATRINGLSFVRLATDVCPASSGTCLRADATGALIEKRDSLTAYVVAVSPSPSPSLDGQCVVLDSATGSGYTSTECVKNLASPVLSGTVTGTYSFGGTPTLASNLTTNAFIGPTYGGTSTNLPPVSWTAMCPCSNSYVDLGGAFVNSAYFKDSTGTVHVRVAVGSGTPAATIINLPAGFRPAGQISAVGIVDNVMGAIIFFANGNISAGAGGAVNVVIETSFMAGN